MEIRRSYGRLISTMGYPILVRRHLFIESGPWSLSCEQRESWAAVAKLLHSVALCELTNWYLLWSFEYKKIIEVIRVANVYVNHLPGMFLSSDFNFEKWIWLITIPLYQIYLLSFWMRVGVQIWYGAEEFTNDFCLYSVKALCITQVLSGFFVLFFSSQIIYSEIAFSH